MPNVLEDLRRVFPKKSFLLKTYMLGCLYLFHQQITPDERKKQRNGMLAFRMLLIESPHQRNFKQFQLNWISNQSQPLQHKVKQSNGLMEFRTPLFHCFQDFSPLNSTSQVHTLQIDSKQVRNFSLDDLSTIESEFIPDIKRDLQTHTPVEMTQSCIF